MVESSQNQIQILDSTYNNIASKSDTFIPSSKNQSDIHQLSYHAAEYALPEQRRTMDASKFDQRSGISESISSFKRRRDYNNDIQSVMPPAAINEDSTQFPLQ
jgi:hypothetical protein